VASPGRRGKGVMSSKMEGKGKGGLKFSPRDKSLLGKKSLSYFAEEGGREGRTLFCKEVDYFFSRGEGKRRKKESRSLM